ncbi:hypothetical protein Syun_015895 [Stephania yunnanensis]|uniref:Uncharacterized protein n=1 Tax=Stephania yunnanensis TaxID=152371 RepID=A0AAP0J651_9MAGN
MFSCEIRAKFVVEEVGLMICVLGCLDSEMIVGEMDVVRGEQVFCLENKQSDVTSSCSFSDGSCDVAALKSPGVCSPATSSPSHRRTTGPIRRAKGGWTQEEDETLRNAVKAFKGRCWKKIAEFFPDRSEVQCLHRWQKVLNPELIKGPWTQKEDDKIVELVSNMAPLNGLPSQKPCQAASVNSAVKDFTWHNHLNPNIKKDAWTLEEELLLMNAQRVHGNKWAEIAKVLPGRKECSIVSLESIDCQQTGNQGSHLFLELDVGPMVSLIASTEQMRWTNGATAIVFVCSLMKTDNSIKNHWNSSLKKKLDFYLATGRLPPVSKTGQNDANDLSQVTDSRNFLVCSNKVSDTAAESSLADICKVEGNCKDQQGSMQQCLYTDASTRDMFVDPSSGAECKSHLAGCEERENCSSGSDFSYSNCDSTPTSIKYRNHLVSDRDNNITGTPLHCVVPAFGFSYREPSHSDNCDVPLNSAVFNKLRSFHQTISNSVASSGSFTKSAGLGQQSAESILKNAAKSFPNTPSIVKRKRKRDLHASVSLDRSRESIDKGKVKEGLQTPEQTERTEKQDHSSSINSSLCESSICHGSTVGLCKGRDLNRSPPYRLRSKRTAVSKSVEKQLDFTSEIDKIEASNQSMNATVKEKLHAA